MVPSFLKLLSTHNPVNVLFKSSFAFICFLLLLAGRSSCKGNLRAPMFSCLSHAMQNKPSWSWPGFELPSSEPLLFSSEFFHRPLMVAFFRRGWTGCLQSVNQLFKWVTRENKSVPHSGMHEVYVTNWRSVSFLKLNTNYQEIFAYTVIHFTYLNQFLCSELKRNEPSFGKL